MDATTTTTTTTTTNYDYCTDPEANVNGSLSLRDALRPCPQLATTVPVLVAVQLLLFVVFAWIRRQAMRKMGLSEPDIAAIFSSRQATTVVEDVEVVVKDLEANASGETVSVSEGSTGKSTSSSDNSSSHDTSSKEEEDNKLRSSIATSSNGSDIVEATDDDLEVVEPPQVEAGLEVSTATMTTTSVVFDLPTLMETYGDKKLRILDSLPRKSVHFLVLLTSSIALEFTTDTFVAQGQTACCSALTTSIILFLCYHCAPDSYVSARLYGWAARIRDGRVARKNLLVAYCAAFSGIFVTYLMGSQGILHHVTPDLQKLLLVLYYAPLAVGDAMGELIGSPFGGMFFPTFRVQGFGEINRKSIEGCFAVFVGSLGSTIVVCLYYGAITSSWMILCLLMAVVTTIVETASFRSTDNFFIPVFNCVVVLLALGPFGNKFQQE